MMKHKWRFLFGGLAGALVAATWWLYNRRPRERIPSHESVDDPEVAQAFGWVATLPQMWLLRWFVAHRAVRMTGRGEAVDLGCGPGQLVIELVRRSPGLHVTGIDLSDEMIARGQDNARRAGVADRVSFRRGDAQQIPFLDTSLDLVVSTLSLHHWSDPVAVLDEIARVLRPSGSFLIFDLRRDMIAPCWLLLWFATHVVVPAALRRVNEPLGSRNAAYTPQEAARLAEQSRLSGWRITRGPLWLTIEGDGYGNMITDQYSSGKKHGRWRRQGRRSD
jgi:ubiquinone/menaquinone biosynthesis C-methylase UbiE